MSGPARTEKSRPATEPSAHAEPRSERPVTSGGLWQALLSSDGAAARGPTAAAVPLADAGGTRVQRLAARAPETPFGVIVDDDATPGPGQIQRTTFVAVTFPAVELTATAELARAGRSARDCPYLARSLAYWRTQPAARLERVIARYARPRATDLGGLLAAIIERVRDAVALWVSSGQLVVPNDEGARAAGVVQGFDGATSADPASVRARLGAGQALDGATRSRMERGFGANLGDVRVHTDGRAARTATSLGARAFAVGSDVAFGAGEYRPGTPRGDLMLAHELAHVLQQRGGDARAYSPNSADALEVDADRAAISAVARAGLAPEHLARHVAVHRPAQGGGLRLQRCKGDPVDYSQAPAPPDYDATVTALRALYAKKIELGRAEQLDDDALAEVDAQIARKVEALRMLGVSIPEMGIETAVSAPGGAKNMRDINPRVTRDPPEGPLFRGRRMRFQLTTDWLPPDEVPEIVWRWKSVTTGGFVEREEDVMYKAKGPTFEMDDEYWAGGLYTVGDYQAGFWNRVGGVHVYARIKLGDKPAVDSPALYVPYKELDPDKMPVDRFQIEATKPVVVVGESPLVYVKGWVVSRAGFWVQWSIDGVVFNPHAGMARDIFARDFDSPGVRKITGALRRLSDSDGSGAPVAVASTSLTVVDQAATGREALAQGEQQGIYQPLSEYRASHDAAMSEMGTRAKLGATGSAKSYWEQRLAAERDRMKSLTQRVPDWESARHVAKGDYFGTLMGATAPDVASTPIPTAIVYPHREGQVVQPLSIYLVTRKVGTGWQASIVDMSGAKVFRFSGSVADGPVAAAASAFSNWKSDNKYPVGGKLVHSFAPPGWKAGEGFSTSTAWKYAEEFLDGLVKLGTYLVIGLLLLAPDATITKVLGVALMAAVTARSAMGIADNRASGSDWLDKENILEGITILTSVIGGAGTAARALGSAARAGVLFRAGNWMIMTTFAVGVGTFVYATVEAIAAIAEILKDRTLTSSDRSMKLLSVIGGLIANGTMLFLSAKAMFGSGLKASDFFKRSIPKKGAGPVEMSEGTRIDLEVALRKRGVDPKALKEMSPEVLLDNYYDLTWTRPELVKVRPDLVGKKLTANQIAREMKLPELPSGYTWAKAKGDRLTVARARGKAKAGAEALVYDPRAPVGKQIVPVPPRKPYIAAAEGVVPAELEASATQAVTARQAIAGVPAGKTGARTPSGETRQSGWGKGMGNDTSALEPVEQLSKKIGFEPEPHPLDAPGKPGSYNNSHAEKQLAAARPGEPIGVNRVMCLDCQRFFARLATATGKPVVVADPAGVRIFLPQKPMITAPNPNAVGGMVGSAYDALEGDAK